MSLPSRGRSLLLLMLWALGAQGCGRTEATLEPGLPPAERVVSVRAVEIEARDVTEHSSMPADIHPFRRALLASEVAGTVETALVEAGDVVRAGQALVRIDTRSLEHGLRQAEAVHRQRQAQFERAQALLERKSITQQQFLDALTHREVAVAALEERRLELARSRVTAPWSGQVASRRVEVGDYVTPGQPVIELLEVRRLKVLAPAPSTDVPHLAVGVSAEVEVGALPGRVFHGRVTRLGAELDRTARTLDVEVVLDNPEGLLKPGMYARLELPRRRIEGALLAPIEALVDFEGGQAVYVAEGGRAARRGVRLGPEIGGEVVVEEGVAAGERVIVEGQLQVSPGQRVVEGAGTSSGEL